MKSRIFMQRIVFYMSFYVFLFLGWYVALTYPKRDGLQKLRIFYTGGTGLEPVSTSKFDYFSGAENMRDIDVFLAGGERYLAIARGTSSMLYKFVGDKTDVTFKLESVFPGSEKIIHFRNEFGSILMTISGNKTNTYVYTDGLFAKMTIIGRMDKITNISI